MDESKYQNAMKLFKIAFLVGGGAMLALAILSYVTTQYVLMGYLAVSGLMNMVAGYSLPFVFERASHILSEDEKHHEEAE